MAPRLPRVYLVRHGETEWSLSGQHTGKSDIPLTANGENVIKQSAPEFVGRGKLICPDIVSHVLISPRQRAQKTFELVNKVSDVPFEEKKNKIVTTEDVGEWDYGDYEGLTSNQIHEKKSDWSIWSDGCPNGESVQDMCARVDRVISKIVDIHLTYGKKLIDNTVQHGDQGADVVIFSHGHFSRCFLARWARLALDRGEILVIDAGSVNVGGYQHHNMEERSLLGLNLHSYLL